MKSYVIILASCLLLLSCKKEEYIDDTPSSHNYTSYHAYFKGVVTDSLTGQPITGYHIRAHKHFFVTGAGVDSLEDGTYLLSASWFSGKFNEPKPKVVWVHLLFDFHPDSILYSTQFNGDLLVECDTVTIDFQVNL